MSKIIKDQINKLKPSATLAINEKSNKLKRSGKKIYKFGFGQSPFPIPDSIILALRNSADKGEPLTHSDPEHEVSKIFKEIAEKVKSLI